MTETADLEEQEQTEDEYLIHAKYNGAEIIRKRYTDEWFIKPTAVVPGHLYYEDKPKQTSSVPKETKQVSVEEAATNAARGVQDSFDPKSRAWSSQARIYFGQEGGTEFDEIVKRVCPWLEIEIEYIDLGDGHPFMGMKCPGCREWMKIDDRQLSGKDCTNHTRGAGGCGFHGYVLGPNAGYVVDIGNVLKMEK